MKTILLIARLSMGLLILVHPLQAADRTQLQKTLPSPKLKINNGKTDWIPEFVYLAKSYSLKHERYYYKIKSSDRNFAHFFTDINLDQVGDDNAEVTFSGIIYLIAQYKDRAYIIFLYRTYNCFSFYRAKLYANGEYMIEKKGSREDIYYPDLYKKLDFLFEEDKSFKHINKLMKEKTCQAKKRAENTQVSGSR